MTPRSGNWAAWLGGDDDEISFISQSVAMPTWATTLTFWHWIASDDLCGYDLAWVRINGTSLLTLDLCSPNNTGGWVQRALDVRGYAGMTVSLEFRVETDDSLNSNYFLDDVALQGGVPGDYHAYLPLTTKKFWPGFFDDFGDPNSGWGNGEYPSVIYRYLNGEYQLYFKTTNSPFGITPDLVLPGDYRIEVDARKVSAGVCSYGLIFGTRFTPNSWETYQVIFWPTDREFLVNKRTLDGTWTTIQDWTYSPAINGGYATNRIRVDRIGVQIRIYVNGTQVTSITDGTFTGPGRDAGMRAYSYWDAPMDVRFDNFRASQP